MNCEEPSQLPEPVMHRDISYRTWGWAHHRSDHSRTAGDAGRKKGAALRFHKPLHFGARYEEKLIPGPLRANVPALDVVANACFAEPEPCGCVRDRQSRFRGPRQRQKKFSSSGSMKKLGSSRVY